MNRTLTTNADRRTQINSNTGLFVRQNTTRTFVVAGKSVKRRTRNSNTDIRITEQDKRRNVRSLPSNNEHNTILAGRRTAVTSNSVVTPNAVDRTVRMTERIMKSFIYKESRGNATGRWWWWWQRAQTGIMPPPQRFSESTPAIGSS